MARCVSPRPLARRAFGLAGLALALIPACGLLAPVPADAAAADLPKAKIEVWSVHRYLGGAIAQVGAADGGWFGVRCESADHVGEIAYAAPVAGDRFVGGAPLSVEILFDDGQDRISRQLVWDEVERHWKAPFGPAQAMAAQMRRGAVMRVTVEDGPASEFSLEGAAPSLARMFEICD